MKRVSGFLFAASLTLSAAGLAQAEKAVYEIPMSGVSCSGSAAKAEAAVRAAGEVQSVSADPARHVVTATFDTDTTKLDAILASLNEAGFEAGDVKRVE